MSTQPITVFLNGYKGRMGQAIAAEAAHQNVVIAAKADAGEPASPAAITAADAVIDFSFHAATLALAQLCVAAKKPLVIGTTGHSAEERAALEKLCVSIPVVWAGNYSVGVNLLNYLVGQAARTLGPDYNIEIVEMHHRHKKDAPSGTAEKLVDIARTARNLAAEDVVYGRHGITGERPDNQIGMHALRGGDVVGDHTVIFAGEGERLELTHKASNRAIFAQGALRAARWLALGKGANGIHGMDEVLGLR